MILDIKGVSKDFGGLRALDDVHIKVEEGDILGLIGPNGSGKSTLLNIITGFLPLTTGAIMYRGEQISGLSPYTITPRGIARTFQITSIFPNLTITENVIAGMYLKAKNSIWGSFFRTKACRREEMELRRKAAEILRSTLGLQNREDTIAKNSAIGEQRNLEIAIALATDPELLLLDEPAAGLNPAEVEQLMSLLISLHKRGVTLLIVEHNMKMVMQLCTRIVVLDYGRKIAEGTPKEIASNSNVISIYLGRGQGSV